MRIFGPFAICLVACGTVFAAPIKIWVELRDKGPGFSSRSRGFEDAPVYAPYLARLRGIGFVPEVCLKWQNLVSGWMDPADTSVLARLSMVLRVENMPRKAPTLRLPGAEFLRALPKAGAATDFGAFQSVFAATGAAALHSALPANTAGRGLRIAVIDVGFSLGHEAFAHLWQQGRIVDQWDFVRGRPDAAYDSLGYSHGAGVLSLVGGKCAAFEGLVPEASFLLYRSEDESGETYVEEDYVAAALERAVDSGAQVISISLGYRYAFTDGSPDLPYADFDGRTRPSSIAALMAARRGALVSIAMGNAGQNPATLGAPADADSVLSVGILDTNHSPCPYSSTGPAADGRIKPEISTLASVNYCLVPHANTAADSGVLPEGGTSFAAPVVTGIAALLRQLHPEVSSQDIRLALMYTAGNSSRPDNFSGYGLVNAWEAHRILTLRPASGLAWFSPNRRRVDIRWRPRLNPAGASLWDLSGRSIPARGGSTGFDYWIEPESQSSGVFVWKLPVK